MKYLILTLFLIIGLSQIIYASESKISLPGQQTFEAELAKKGIDTKKVNIAFDYLPGSRRGTALSARLLEKASFLGYELEKDSLIFFKEGKFRWIRSPHSIYVGVVTCQGNIALRNDEVCQCKLERSYKDFKYSIDQNISVIFSDERPTYFYPTNKIEADDSVTVISEDEFERREFCYLDRRPKILTCPNGTYKENPESSDIVQCCKIPMENGTCSLERPKREFFKDLETMDEIRHTELNFKNNLPDGDFTEWIDSEKEIRVTGQFKSGKPVDSWKINKANGKLSYLVNYSKTGNLVNVKLPATNVKDLKTIQFAIQTPTERPNKNTVIGFHERNERFYVNPNYSTDSKNLNQAPFDYTILYKNFDKKEAVGIAIGDYRFYSAGICKSTCDPSVSDGNSYWEVVEKKENRCRSYLSAGSIYFREKTSQVYSVWFECRDFESVMEEWRGGTPAVDAGTKFYDKPGGHGVHMELRLERLNIEVIEKKLFEGALWLHVRLYQDLGDSRKDKAQVWIPFYDGEKVNVISVEKIDNC